MLAAFVVAGLFGAAIDALASDSTRPSVPDTDGDLQIGRARVQVRVYDNTVMSVADQTVALRAATAVLAAAGIDVTWLVCGHSDASNPGACASPLTGDQLAVRLVRLTGTPSARGQMSLGYALLDMSVGSGGTLATVYVDRVEWLVSHTRNLQISAPNSQGTPENRLLGFAVAHEVGHLLLGTNTHAAAGLMRAVWSQGDLQRNDPADWVFTTAEGLAMSRALRQRQVRMTWNR